MVKKIPSEEEAKETTSKLLAEYEQYREETFNSVEQVISEHEKNFNKKGLG